MGRRSNDGYVVPRGPTMRKPEFAFLGGQPALASRVGVGQRYFPSVARFEDAIAGIFERQYYTEYGPLNRQLEDALQAALNVEHAICVATDSIALLMTTDALMLGGSVIVPAMATAAAAAVECCGLRPVLCDMDPATFQMDVRHLERLIDGNTAAILAAHLWGGICDIGPIAALAHEAGVELYFDACHAFGCKSATGDILAAGRATVFSFAQDNIVNATEGACICTNDRQLAARLRVMRASSGVMETTDVKRTVNGRFSELQAAIGQMSLADFPANRRRNEAIFRRYELGLSAIPGIRLVRPHGAVESNHQAVVCQADEAAFGLPLDRLVALLSGENIDTRTLGMAPAGPPHAAMLGRTSFQLPVGAQVSDDVVDSICRVIRAAHEHSPLLAGAPS
jgi:dTDP-4-amino-4,6-dideoxygalactose transaminase